MKKTNGGGENRISNKKKKSLWLAIAFSLLAVILAGTLWYFLSERLGQETAAEGENAPAEESAFAPEGVNSSAPEETSPSSPEEGLSPASGREDDSRTDSEPGGDGEDEQNGTGGEVHWYPAPEPRFPYDLGVELTDIPPYENSANIPINGNRPFFTETEFTTESFEIYGDLDELGRCTYAYACVGEDLMPMEKRGSISEIRPSGWQITKYDGIDGNYLYNRCHLIAYGLTAENANECNLITGTRYMNTTGMNDLENDTIGYIRRTHNHVLYRVTPFFEGDNLVASGVLMEAQSVEKDDFHFCVYAYNVQPGITIDYATGESSGAPFTGTEEPHPRIPPSPTPVREFIPPEEDVTYVLNTHSMKFHLPECSAVKEMNSKNRMDFTGTREELIEQGYQPCGSCSP